MKFTSFLALFFSSISCILGPQTSLAMMSGDHKPSVEILHLPNQDNALSEAEIVKMHSKELLSILNYVRNKEKGPKPEKVKYLSLEEAKLYFRSYLEKSLTPEEEKQGLLEEILSPEFISEEAPFDEPMPKEKEAALVQDNFKQFLATSFFNAVNDYSTAKSAEDKESIKKSFEAQRARVKINTLLADPKDLYEMFKNSHGWLPKRLREDPHGENYAKYREGIEEFFSYKYFGIPKNPAERKQHFLTHDLGLMSQKLVHSVYQGAKRMMSLTGPGDTFIIFGNTPYFVGRALNFLISTDLKSPMYRKIIEFPFSGSPNRSRPGNYADNRNWVTPLRLTHLRARLKKAGLGSENESLLKHEAYFIDDVATGSGIAYAGEEILRDFKAAGKPTPHLHVMTMNKMDVEGKNDVHMRNATIAKMDRDATGHTTLYFPSLQDTHFTIDSQEVFIAGHGKLDNLPSNDWRVFPEYNPMYWQHTYEGRLTRPHSEHTQLLLDYFDENIRALMEHERGH